MPVMRRRVTPTSTRRILEPIGRRHGTRRQSLLPLLMRLEAAVCTRAHHPSLAVTATVARAARSASQVLAPQVSGVSFVPRVVCRMPYAVYHHSFPGPHLASLSPLLHFTWWVGGPADGNAPVRPTGRGGKQRR